MAVIAPVAVRSGFRGLVEMAELIGEPLEAHQRRIARTWLESEAREVVTIAPKGNHKTTTVALAGVHELLSNPDAGGHNHHRPPQGNRLMPAIQRGQAYRLGPNKWGLRYYTAEGRRKRVSPFDSKSAALRHYRDVIEPELRGEPARMPELTLAELVDLYLERHAATVRPRTIATLRERLAHATRAFGDVPLRDLERMRGEIASWQAKLPERSRYGLVQAFRQTLGAAVRWGYMGANPATLAGRNRQPAPRTVRV